MTRRKRQDREEDVEPVIPTNLSANITDSMRAETKQASAEVFENNKPTTASTASSASTTSDLNAPPNTALTLPGSSEKDEKSATKSMPSTTIPSSSKPEREPQVKFITNEDKLLDFDGDLLQVYSQSSGTISYDSFQPLQSDAFEKLKSEAKKVNYKGPEAIIAHEQNLLDNASCQPSLETFKDEDFNRSVYADECPGISFERAHHKAVHLRATREQAYVKALVSDMLNEYLKSGRDDFDLKIHVTRRNKLPILNMQLEKCDSSKSDAKKNKETSKSPDDEKKRKKLTK